MPLNWPLVKCLTLGINDLPHVGASQKNKVGVLVLALEDQVLMSKILIVTQTQCDLEGVRSTMASLDDEIQSGSAMLNKVLLERCDGNRNVFHACVSIFCQYLLELLKLLVLLKLSVLLKLLELLKLLVLLLQLYKFESFGRLISVFSYWRYFPHAQQNFPQLSIRLPQEFLPQG